MQEQLDACTGYVAALNECVVAAGKWEQLYAQAENVRIYPPLEVRIGLVMDAKLIDGSTHADLAAQWGADSSGLVGKDEFMKYALMLKNGGDLKVDGSTTEVKDNLVLLFETLSTAYAPQSETGSAANGESGMKMDVQAVMAMMGAVVKTHKDKEQKISAALNKVMERARALQATYAEESARKDKR